MPEDKKTMWSIEDVAGRLSLCSRTVERLVKEGRIPCMRVESAGGKRAGRLLFDPAVIERWIVEQHQHQQNTEPTES